MEKLLHERLRESAAENRFWRTKFELDVGGTIIRLVSSEADAIADEIERFYVPRPLFEDGTPVQFGDETGNGAADSFTFYDTCDVDIYIDNGSDSVFVPRGEFVKRPTKKTAIMERE